MSEGVREGEAGQDLGAVVLVPMLSQARGSWQLGWSCCQAEAGTGQGAAAMQLQLTPAASKCYCVLWRTIITPYCAQHLRLLISNAQHNRAGLA